MATELTLMVLEGHANWRAENSLRVATRSALWPEISNLTQVDVPEPVWCDFARSKRGERKYSQVVKDGYGTRLKWTTAKELLKLKQHEHVQDTWRNQAVWAFLAKIPSDWPIVLYWH